MKRIGLRLLKTATVLLLTLLLYSSQVSAQTAEELIQKVREKLEKVNDYEAKGKMKTNVVFIKAPVATVKVYFKKTE